MFVTRPEQTPPNGLRTVLLGLSVLLVSAPIAVFATLVATPVWRFIERTARVEAIGHSGPNEWCYVATYAVVVAAIGVMAMWKRRSTGAPS